MNILVAAAGVSFQEVVFFAFHSQFRNHCLVLLMTQSYLDESGGAFPLKAHHGDYTHLVLEQSKWKFYLQIFMLLTLIHKDG